MLSSAAGFYLLFFQLQTMNSELRDAITTVNARQHSIEQALALKRPE